MEPLKINIEVSLSNGTLEALRRCVTAVTAAIITNHIAHGEKIAEDDAKAAIAAAFNLVEGSEAENGAAQAPQNEETEEAPAESGDAAPAAPEAPAAEARTYTDPELRAVVKEAKTRTSAQHVREVFAKFDIATSIDCPQERRAELVDALNALV